MLQFNNAYVLYSVFQVTSGFQQAFEKKGIILAKHLEKEASVDDAEEAAILAGAEEVSPEEDGEHIYRVCFIDKVDNKL